MNISYLDFFPYDTYRREQLELISHIELDTRLRKNILLIAPSGTGKTAVALSGILPVAIEYNLKIIYLCRTHTQSARVIKELRKISSHFPHRIKGMALRSRIQLCLHSALIEDRSDPIKAMHMCRHFRTGASCLFYRNLKSKFFPSVQNELEERVSHQPIDGDQIYHYGKEANLCPYFLSLDLLKSMRVVVCTFQWLLDPNIRPYLLNYLGVDIQQCILVMDECHNVIDMATKINSNILPMSFLITCLQEIQEIPTLPEELREKYGQLLWFLVRHLAKKKRKLSAGDVQIDPLPFLNWICDKLHFTLEQFSEFLSHLRRRIQGNFEKYEMFDRVKYFIAFWERFLHFSSGRYFFCYHSSKKKDTISLEIISIDPRESTAYLFLNNYACINLTATVDPDVYSTLTGFNQKKTGFKYIIANSPFLSKNIRALITEGVDTKKDHRTPEMYRKMVQKIEEVISSTPKNIGIFCASYHVLKNLLNNGLSKMVRAHGKKIFIEEPNNSALQNSLLLKNFRKVSKKQGGVLLGVCGGRNSEGENYPGDDMNAVIIVGIPYHYPSLRTTAKIAYYNKVFQNQGWLFAYLSPAMQRANQAAGRPIRRETDKGAIIFLDSRFITNVAWISEWIQKELQIIPDQKGAISQNLKEFWN